MLISCSSLNIILFLQKYWNVLESRYQILSSFCKIVSNISSFITKAKIVFLKTNDFGLKLLL